MDKIDELIENLVEYLRKLDSTTKDENSKFMEFYRFFNQNFDKLSKSEQDRLMTMLERNNKLKKLLES